MGTTKKTNSNKFVFAIAFCNFFDSAFPAATGLALPYWTLAFGIPAYGNGVLGALGCNAFGSAFGALIGGIISDRVGRKKAYRIGLIVALFGSLISIFTWNFASLAVGFACMGLGTGICVPVGWTYISELSEAKDRSVNIGISQAARPIAIALMYVLFFFFTILLPATDTNGSLFPMGTYWIFDGLIGSRLFFVLLALIGVCSIISQRSIPESSAWQKKNEKIFDFKYAKKILTNKNTLKSILFLTLVYVSWNVVAGTITQFMPTMANSVHLEGTPFAIVSISVCICALISVSLFPKCVKRWSYKTLYAFGCITSILGMFAILLFVWQFMYWGDALRWIIAFFPIFWGAQTGFSAQTFFSIWSTELFPTKVRSIIQGISFFLVRGLSGFWSLFVFGILDATTPQGTANTVIVMMILLTIGFIVGVIFCPKTQDKSLDKITEEIYGDVN